MKLIDVTVRFPGSTQGLGPWTIEGPDDVPWLIMGPSGSGKTTFLKTVSGRLVHGGVVHGAPPQDQTAYLPQFPERVLAGRNIAEDLSSDPAPDARKRRQLRSFLDGCGLSVSLHRDSRRLSGGEKRRLLLAMVTAAGWRHWGLDEPESGLDCRGRQDLLSWIQREIESSPGAKWIGTSSPWMYLALNPFCVILQEGKIVSAGMRDEVLDREGVWDLLGFSAHPAGRVWNVIAAQFHNLDNNVWKKLREKSEPVSQVQVVLRDSEVLY